jgi:triosephosphate isomerase
MARRKLIAGNWKMNGLRADAQALVDTLVARRAADRGFDADLLICPPATLLDRIGQRLEGSPILMGAQDAHAEQSGAFTGDYSAAMAKDLGASHVIVGHSERRDLHGESNQLVRAKAEAVLAAGLVAIICVGESDAERRAGRATEVVCDQLCGSLPEGASPDNLVIAYEPIWAVGSGRIPTGDEVVEIHSALRNCLRDSLGSPAEGVRLLYGGSVKPSNAGDFLALPDVDGCLVGGASLKADEFWAIALASQKVPA